ncbi:hypothetical protein [Halalkalicoccus jeotgali]|uniref:hypothetical protein n=1 Tax=Halalkalicoccus jeotgali TaxID=413810 RepID=UPI001EE68A03|nr:hypothetical protein [Halalkalicoccus jeotgali]
MRLQQRFVSETDAGNDEELSDELAQSADCIEEKRAVFIRLYTAYYDYHEFSKTVLDVELESWLALHPQGSSVLETVSEIVTDRQELKQAEDWFESLYPDPRITLDESASGRCLVLTTPWEAATATIP